MRARRNSQRERKNASLERELGGEGTREEEEKLLDFSIYLQGLLQLIYMRKGPQLTASG